MPRDITITFEDGTTHVYKGAPDDVTPDQVTARASKEFGKSVASLDGGRGQSLGSKVMQQAGNALAGAVRGAGSIGATLLTPYDILAGNTKSIGNPERRQAMTDALQTMGADPESLAFQGSKLLTEVGGTLGVGGALTIPATGAKVFGATVPAMLPSAANLPLVQAIGSAGFKAAGATGLPGLAARTAGGAITGGAAAGLVDPEQAGMGALIGGALPGVVQGAGIAGRKVGETLRGPVQSADMAQAIQQARGVGYVIPPAQAKPSMVNRVMEGMSGKITTAQNASAKNQEVTSKLAAEALGLPGDTKLTTEVLDQVRAEAGKAYEALKALPVKPAQKADTLANIPAAAEINPKQMVFDLRKARNDATAWFRSYGRTADPDSLAKAQAAASKSSALEKGLEDYASGLGLDDLVQSMREARTRIAKTYSVEDALNAATGAVDARKLAKQLDKGKPLSGELKTAAEFAARFPKAAQTVEGMGSLPQTSPLDWVPAGALSMATSNPLMMLGVGARPAARALALSPVVQNRLVQSQTPNALQALLANPELAQLGYRAAPNALNGR